MFYLPPEKIFFSVNQLQASDPSASSLPLLHFFRAVRRFRSHSLRRENIRLDRDLPHRFCFLSLRSHHSWEPASAGGWGSGSSKAQGLSGPARETAGYAVPCTSYSYFSDDQTYALRFLRNRTLGIPEPEFCGKYRFFLQDIKRSMTNRVYPENRENALPLCKKALPCPRVIPR